MARVIMFSRQFPAYHPKRGEKTYFVEKIWESLNIAPQAPNPLCYDDSFDLICEFEPKHHTIRAGNRWKAGDYFSPRVWSGKPYRSKQIIIAPDIEIKKVWDFELYNKDGSFFINGNPVNSIEAVDILANNDGLDSQDLADWFPKPFSGQIISWSTIPNYLLERKH